MSPKAKKLLKIILPIYALFVVAFIVVSVMFHETRNLVAADGAAGNLVLLEPVKFKITVEDPVLGSYARDVEYAKGTRITKEVYQMLESAGRTNDLRVTGTSGVIAFDHTAIFQGLNFLVFMVLLYGLLWDPILKVLDERRDRIRQDLDTASSERKKAQKVRAEYESRLRAARDEHAEIIAEARKIAQAQTRTAVEEAQDEAARILNRAREQTEAEVNAARTGLRKEVGALATSLAGRILEREISETDHARITQGFIAEIEGACGPGAPREEES